MTETNGTRSDAPGPAPDGAHPGFFRAGPVLMLAVAAVIVLVDQIAKVVAVATLEGGRPVRIIGDSVRLVLLRNPGAAFSMGTESTVVLSLVATAVVLGLLWFSRRVHSRWWAWGLGLILGGAAGNLVDRYFRAPGILQGHVVDYVSVGWWPVFNVADSCLVAGVIVVAVAVLRGMDIDGSREQDRDHADRDHADG
ncbi:signal peptidase II [Dietzia sp. UBA5065]|jgi:signal peptidase II|uniref:signal peptidase II n=1 Tax=Dietzia sp. UBA5065 TaxID=1946422 RepID=UPI0025C179CB|nr:signal peptidase II [Dietzia sp. UBA5065]